MTVGPAMMQELHADSSAIQISVSIQICVCFTFYIEDAQNYNG